LLLLCVAVAKAEIPVKGRIKSLFAEHPVFDEDLLIMVFREKPTEEFLLTEAASLVDELILEFGDWIQKE